MKLDKNYFPGWVRKSMTFTIDDGNVKLDRKFLGYVKPAGFRGSFNLCAAKLSALDPAGYRAFYDGFEVTNHCKHHPFLLDPSVDLAAVLTDAPFDPETADPEKCYPVENMPGFYHFHATNGWRTACDFDTYLHMVDEGKAEIEEIFGKGSVKAYVWPYFEQRDPRALPAIVARGYESVRKTGEVLDSTGYALPADRTRWSYNATYKTMEEQGEKYESYPDDGELKFFCFGVHSHDFENAGRWDVLEDFVAKYGNRPEDFWYASVGDIFAYEDAVKALIVTDTELRNDSDVDLFVKVDGKRVVVRRRSTVAIG